MPTGKQPEPPAPATVEVELTRLPVEAWTASRHAAWRWVWDWLLSHQGYPADAPDLVAHPALSCSECTKPLWVCTCAERSRGE